MKAPFNSPDLARMLALLALANEEYVNGRLPQRSELGVYASSAATSSDKMYVSLSFSATLPEKEVRAILESKELAVNIATRFKQ